ncbi:nuclear transport factor 2 family protein [Actinocorallia aurea]
MTTFRAAIEARDIDAIADLLADDVVFTSPIAFQPYEGKAMTLAILRGVMRVFEDFRYLREIGSPEDTDHALIFQTTIDGRTVQGCDFLHRNADGKIDELMVMVRPLSGANALAEGMGAQFDQIKAEALAG